MMSESIDQRLKTDQERRTEVESFRSQAENLSSVIEQQIEDLYSNTFNKEEHAALKYELSKLKLNQASFSAILNQMDGCNDWVRIFNRRISKIEETRTGKYWWLKAKWLSEAIRTVAYIGGTVIVMHAFLLDRVSL